MTAPDSPAPDLSDVTVRDVMRTDVVTVPPNLPVAELIQLLEEHGVTGVPVVDADEHVVGVVSVSDVARAAGEEARGRTTAGSSEAGASPSRPDRDRFFRDTFLPESALAGALPSSLPQSRLGSRSVREIMTPATFSVRPDASLPELAGFLVRAGIHRALVFDGPALAGLVASTDVLRAVAELGDRGARSGDA